MLLPSLSSVANGKGSLVDLAGVCRASGLADMPGHQEILEENGPELAEQWRESLGFPGMFRERKRIPEMLWACLRRQRTDAGGVQADVHFA